MLSTSVYCVIHVTTVLVILFWAPGFTKGKGYCRSNPGRETCSSTEIMFCHPGQRPQIVEAYFVNATDYKVCGVNCKATPAADGDLQCLADIRRTGFPCVQRLSCTDLDAVYNTCAALSRHCRFSSLSDTNLLSLRSNFTVDYLCIQDAEVNIACTPHPTSPSDSTKPTPGGPTKSEEGDQNPTLIIIIVAAVIAVAVAAGVLFAIIFIIRKRRGRQKRQGNAETKRDNKESHPENQTHASLPLPNDGDYTECFLPDDSNPDPRDPEAEPIMTTHPGCDVGDEYVTLQHDARVGMAGRSEESENYDHMPVGTTRPRSDVYNVLQREQKKQAVVDNVYNTTSLTP